MQSGLPLQPAPVKHDLGFERGEVWRQVTWECLPNRWLEGQPDVADIGHGIWAHRRRRRKMEICCDIEKLIRQPQLRARYDSYAPPDDVLEALRAIDEPTTVAVVYGFWCPDSLVIVPEVLKSMTEADNDNLQVLGATVPLDETYDLPLDVGGISVRRFPTVAFLRGRFQTTEEIDPESEVVRFVEESLDADRLRF